MLIDADGDGPGRERLARALEEAGHRPDLSFEARLRPMVALMGDVAQEAVWVRAQARRLQGSRALAIYTAREVVADILTLELDRLSPEDSTRLARGASPEIGLEAAEAAGELGDGLPGADRAPGARRPPLARGRRPAADTGRPRALGPRTAGAGRPAGARDRPVGRHRRHADRR